MNMIIFLHENARDLVTLTRLGLIDVTGQHAEHENRVNSTHPLAH